MGSLNLRDQRVLTVSLLNKLNELVNGNEDKCLNSEDVFLKTDKQRVFDISVLPTLIQDLSNEGYIYRCNNLTEIRITKRGKDLISRNLEGNFYSVLSTLVKSNSASNLFSNVELQSVLIDLHPEELNYAVKVLEEDGMVIAARTPLDAPYTFSLLSLTPHGRNEYRRRIEIVNREKISFTQNQTFNENQVNNQTIYPVGSPYGFTENDWILLREKKNQRHTLHVTFGYQFESSHYDTGLLVKNVHNTLDNALSVYNNRHSSNFPISLDFVTLSAGYGEHLLNNIAREIISSDVCIFDISDQNPNVMIETGIALTWGKKILIIKEKGCEHAPSDISGQTWVEYVDSGIILDESHVDKLVILIKSAMLKKR